MSDSGGKAGPLPCNMGILLLTQRRHQFGQPLKLLLGKTECPMEIDIRPYDEADFDPVTDVWFKSWESIGLGIPQPSIQAELCERFPREIAGGWTVYVATKETKIIGFLALDEDRLVQLFDDPSMQNCGVGKQLLDFVKTIRPDGFWLTTPSEGRAARFYEREGMQRGETSMHARFGHEVVRYEWCS
jgi:GNAT superfamily N-acetyltransferase